MGGIGVIFSVQLLLTSWCEWGAIGRWVVILGCGAQKKPSVLMTLTKQAQL